MQRTSGRKGPVTQLQEQPSLQPIRAYSDMLPETAAHASRGRETEVPHLVMEALRRTELRGCKKSSRHAQKALAIIGVGSHPCSFDPHPHLSIAGIWEDAERTASLSLSRPPTCTLA